MNLEQIEISEGMVEDALSNEHVRIVSKPYAWAFNENGDLW